jgi:hypothetical protein
MSVAGLAWQLTVAHNGRVSILGGSNTTGTALGFIRSDHGPPLDELIIQVPSGIYPQLQSSSTVLVSTLLDA